MSYTHVELLELEKFFEGINIPKVVRINKAIVQNDAPKFIKENIELLKAKSMAQPVANGRYKHLLDLKAAILDPIK